jgi:hypothetical protein
LSRSIFRYTDFATASGGRHYFLNPHSDDPPTELFTEYLIPISQEEAVKKAIRKSRNLFMALSLLESGEEVN